MRDFPTLPPFLDFGFEGAKARAEGKRLDAATQRRMAAAGKIVSRKPSVRPRLFVRPIPRSSLKQHLIERVCPVCARSAQNRGATPAKRTRHAFSTALRFVLASPCRRPCSSSSARRALGPVKLAASVPRLPPVCKYLLDRASAVDNEGAQTRACCCCTTPTKVLVQKHTTLAFNTALSVLSGAQAPEHFHCDAWNAVAWGEKHWFPFWSQQFWERF